MNNTENIKNNSLTRRSAPSPVKTKESIYISSSARPTSIDPFKSIISFQYGYKAC